MTAQVREFNTVRVHEAVTANLEKKLLSWIAKRLPAQINSDHLTSLGAVAMLGAGACFWIGGGALSVVIPLLALNWFGDSLDGTLARVRNRQRPRYGYYVDHVLDAAGFVITQELSAKSKGAVAFNGTEYLAVWEDNREGLLTDAIYATRLDAAGTPIDSPALAIATGK